MHLPPPPPPPVDKCCCPFLGGGSVVGDSLLSVTSIVGFCNCSIFCCALLYFHSSFAITFMGKRELISFRFCLPGILRLLSDSSSQYQVFFLQFVIVVFPYHTHLLYLLFKEVKKCR